MSNNFGCVARYLILGVGFRVKLSEEVIADIEVLRDVAIWQPFFGFLYMGYTLAPLGEYD